MNKIDRRTVSLPAEQGEYIDRLVDSGEYGSASEVVRAGIRALQRHDRAIEQWLRTEVVETYDKMTADPSRGIAVEDIRNESLARFASRKGAA